MPSHTTVALGDDAARLREMAAANDIPQVRIEHLAGGLALHSGDLAFLLMTTHALWRAVLKAKGVARFGVGEGVVEAGALAGGAGPNQVVCTAAVAAAARRDSLAPVHALGGGLSELFAADDP
jgi:hypothetical protein